MKRSDALAGLSREHHEALVLARRAADADPSSQEAARVREHLLSRWAAQFVPHFATEEREVFAALAAAGHPLPAEQARMEHTELRSLLEQVRAGDLSALRPWGEAMRAHVRFEEQTVFPLAESALDLHRLAAAAAPRPSPFVPST